MLEKLLLWSGISIIVSISIHSFYLMFKKYDESDDPTQDLFSHINELFLIGTAIVIIDWVLLKYLPKGMYILFFKIFCFLWGTFLLLIAYILYQLFEL